MIGQNGFVECCTLHRKQYAKCRSISGGKRCSRIVKVCDFVEYPNMAYALMNSLFLVKTIRNHSTFRSYKLCVWALLWTHLDHGTQIVRDDSLTNVKGADAPHTFEMLIAFFPENSIFFYYFFFWLLCAHFSNISENIFKGWIKMDFSCVIFISFSFNTMNLSIKAIL